MISLDLRGRRLPADPRTHTQRLNDWVGSSSYVEGARRDPGDTPMPEGELRRYVLNQDAWDNYRRVPAGTVVELVPGQVGPQHDLHPEEQYPDEHAKAYEGMHAPRVAAKVEEMISLDEHKRVVTRLEEGLAERIAAAVEERLARHEAATASAKEPTGLAALSPEAKAEVKEAVKEAGATGELSPEAKAALAEPKPDPRRK